MSHDTAILLVSNWLLAMAVLGLNFVNWRLRKRYYAALRELADMRLRQTMNGGKRKKVET